MATNAVKLLIEEIKSKKRMKSHRLDIHLDAILELREAEISYEDIIEKFLKPKGVQISFSGLRAFCESRLKRIRNLEQGLPAPRPGRPKKAASEIPSLKKSQQTSPGAANLKPNPFGDAARKSDREFFRPEEKKSMFDIEPKNNN